MAEGKTRILMKTKNNTASSPLLKSSWGLISKQSQFQKVIWAREGSIIECSVEQAKECSAILSFERRLEEELLGQPAFSIIFTLLEVGPFSLGLYSSFSCSSDTS